MRGLRRKCSMELHTIGIDLGKTVFHLVGLNLRGEVVVRKKFLRTQLLRFTANIHLELIGMEACGGAHFPLQRTTGDPKSYLLRSYPLPGTQYRQNPRKLA